MGYCIDSWKTKKIENLVIPLEAFYEHERDDWHPKQPKIVNVETMEVEIDCNCPKPIKGFLKDGNIHVTELEIYGEFSEPFKSWILDSALKKSKGKLEALLIWEGGDSISTYKVKDGVIIEKDL